jgi:uncharacterized protein (DUF433 family)
MAQAAEKHWSIVPKEGSGEPMIAGTGMPVRAVAEIWLMGAQPEEILLHHPHLTLSQVFDALSYYADHRSEIDRIIEANKVPEALSGKRLF